MQLLFYCPKFLLVPRSLSKELLQYRDWSLHRIIFLCSQTSIKSLPPFAAEITTALYSCCSSLSSAITFLYKYAALKNPTDTQRPPIKIPVYRNTTQGSRCLSCMLLPHLTEINGKLLPFHTIWSKV